MSKLSADKLTELVEHNKQMLRDAEDGNWEKVTENELIRQQLLKVFYSESSEEYEAEDIINAIQEIFLINQEMTRLVWKARDKVKNVIAELGKGKAAINAYTKHMP
ncbi:MAG: flagellar protein FliT [Gammaproteobacteria bacterium]|jgi:hypothetical protein|nr:flagellar protein FliT [Gammaproteobacteria bacterium]